MPHYYARLGTRIELDEAPDHIGVRFADVDATESARRASRTMMMDAKPAGDAPACTPVRPLHARAQRLSAAAPVAAVVNAMPGRLATRVARTMPVFFERHSGLKIVATEQILVRFKPKATASARRKLLESLELMVIRASEFDPRARS